MISPEVWLPPYTPFDHPLSPQNFFTSWPLILNHDLELCHIVYYITLKTMLGTPCILKSYTSHRHRQKNTPIIEPL